VVGEHSMVYCPPGLATARIFSFRSNYFGAKAVNEVAAVALSRLVPRPNFACVPCTGTLNCHLIRNEAMRQFGARELQQ
jgi:hypothetical protein